MLEGKDKVLGVVDGTDRLVGVVDRADLLHGLVREEDGGTAQAGDVVEPRGAGP